jgi:hypothetical protein
MTDKVIKIDNILPRKTNTEIINLLLQQHWGFAVDTTNGYSTLLNYVFDKKNYGFYLITSIDNKDVKNTPQSVELNTFAKTITDIVTSKLGIEEKVNIHRFYWNMYFNNSVMIEHTDWEDDSHLTILYNLHTTDGGIEINKTFYEDVMGQAKIFHGMNMHKGIAPNNDPIRFNLNVVFKKPKNFILK